ncbi:uncharacterized protein LOC117168790 isoform X2 [Belonocnema kinseyi]|uniref:uncharacterized protein LOC117168790 isoform X2 n=1 Tax=Belonocnema kinseyi TaxID=2817044 RepID=UPI00143DD5FB|nr:uncharacterized protein LOC117168790 isoform X2 [Belonocnema kinseyi]
MEENENVEKARDIAKIEIEARRKAKKNVCGLSLEDCAYCPIIEECVKNLKDRKARGEKVDVKKPKVDFRVQWKISSDPYLYNDRNYAILPDVPKRFKDLKNKIKMNDLFYACFCEKRFDRKRKLVLNGNDLYPRIGRRFQDSDMQSLLDFLEKNGDVTSLSLAYNEIRSSFTKLVDYLKKNQHVLELNLQNNEIGEFGINYLCREPESLKLRMLRLNGNKFGVESSKKVALFLAKNQYLKHLDVAEVDQTISSLVYYTTVLRFDQDQYSKTLKILDISRPNPGYMCNFDSAHWATLIGSMLKFNETLVELHLQKFGFSCHDIELMLTDAKYNKTLHLLDLNENNIGDYGVEIFSDWFTEKPALRGLLLSHNIVTNNGARMLDLSHNRIDDAGAIDILNSIKKSSPMRHLRLFGNRIKHPTAKIVERMLLSGVLVQENLDLKPYKVDGELNFAHYPADHYKQRYYNVPSYSYPKPLRIPFIKNVFKGMEKPKVNFKYVDPVPTVSRRSKIDKNHPFECVCCKYREDQITNSLASPSTLLNETQNICESCVCSTLEEKKIIKQQPEIYNYSREENYPECFCDEEESQKLENSESSMPLTIKEKTELVLQQVDSEIGLKILRWMTIDESIFEQDLNEIAYQNSESKRE